MPDDVETRGSTFARDDAASPADELLRRRADALAAGDVGSVARHDLTLGTHFAGTGDLVRARRHLEAAADAHDTPETRVAVADVYRRLGLLRQAAEALAGEVGTTAGARVAAWIAVERQRFAEAAGLRASTAPPEPDPVLDALIARGLGRFAESIAMLETVRARIGDESAVEVRAALGWSHALSGSHDEALLHFEAVREGRRTQRDASWADATRGFGVLRARAGDLDASRELIDAARHAFANASRGLGLAACELDLGSLARAAGELDRAVDHFRRALAAYRAADSPKGIADTSTALATALSAAAARAAAVRPGDDAAPRDEITEGRDEAEFLFLDAVDIYFAEGLPAEAALCDARRAAAWLARARAAPPEHAILLRRMAADSLAAAALVVDSGRYELESSRHRTLWSENVASEVRVLAYRAAAELGDHVLISHLIADARATGSYEFPGDDLPARDSGEASEVHGDTVAALRFVGPAEYRLRAGPRVRTPTGELALAAAIGDAQSRYGAVVRTGWAVEL
jgi:tetratricopeptide (TPR) repeat protein